jgi:hypothetical protein
MRRLRTSSVGLPLLGLACAAFFWASDPKLGVEPLRVEHSNAVDAIHENWPGTYLGLAGSAAVTLIGIVLLVRRTA